MVIVVIADDPSLFFFSGFLWLESGLVLLFEVGMDSRATLVGASHRKRVVEARCWMFYKWNLNIFPLSSLLVFVFLSFLPVPTRPGSRLGELVKQ